MISDDGQKIVYINAAFELRIMNSDGTGDTLISPLPGGTVDFSVSSDGKEIAFGAMDAKIYLASFTADPSDPLNLQVGPDKGDQFVIGIDWIDARASALGVDSFSLTTRTGALDAVDKIDSAIDTVSNYRAELGIIERRLINVTNDLAAEYINVSAARSRIEDADMAAEISEYSKIQIMAQSTQAMLAHSNAAPQAMLELIK